jgi:hypothetical protein
MTATTDKTDVPKESIQAAPTAGSADATSTAMNHEVFGSPLESLQILKNDWSNISHGKDSMGPSDLFALSQSGSAQDREAAAYALQHFDSLSGIYHQTIDGTGGPVPLGDPDEDRSNQGVSISQKDVGFAADMVAGNTGGYVAQSIERDIHSVEETAVGAVGSIGLGGGFLYEGLAGGSGFAAAGGLGFIGGGAIGLGIAGYGLYEYRQESNNWSQLASTDKVALSA